MVGQINWGLNPPNLRLFNQCICKHKHLPSLLFGQGKVAVALERVAVQLTFLFFSASQCSPLQEDFSNSLFNDDVMRSVSGVVSKCSGTVMLIFKQQDLSR